MRQHGDFYQLMEIFCAVVREGSFSAAADALDMKTPTISKAIRKLEDGLGVTLLTRTTRSMSLTEPGIYFHRESLQMLDHAAAVQEAIGKHRSRPQGRLVVSATVAVGQHLLGPALPGFLALYPDINVDLRLTDAVLDIAAEGIDVALRSSASLPDMGLYSKLVSTQERMLVAAQSYLAARDEPHTPEELQVHSCLVYRAARALDRWSFEQAGHRSEIKVQGALTSNSYATIVQAARAGVGIANVFHYLVKEDLETGRLRQILGAYGLPSQNIFALYHQRRETSSKLDAFLSYLESANLG